MKREAMPPAPAQWVGRCADPGCIVIASVVSKQTAKAGLSTCNPAGQVMLDPYAAVAAKVQLPDSMNVPPPRKGLAPTIGQSNPPALLGCLSALLDSFDWEGTRRPRTMLEDSLVLELDVPSFTSGPNADGEVSPEHRGASESP